MCENINHENRTGKCLCPYCSGSEYTHRYELLNHIEYFILGIAKGLTAMNEQNVLECNQLVDSYENNRQGSFEDLSTKLDNLNPVQCFDILDKLCSKYSS
jgi:hypothetical protein